MLQGWREITLWIPSLQRCKIPTSLAPNPRSKRKCMGSQQRDLIDCDCIFSIPQAIRKHGLLGSRQDSPHQHQHEGSPQKWQRAGRSQIKSYCHYKRREKSGSLRHGIPGHCHHADVDQPSREASPEVVDREHCMMPPARQGVGVANNAEPLGEQGRFASNSQRAIDEIRPAHNFP
jgi:hypothetical protein